MARLNEGAFCSLFFQRHSESNQSPRIVALMQFHIGKQNAVAAQSAIRTKPADEVIILSTKPGRFHIFNPLYKRWAAVILPGMDPARSIPDYFFLVILAASPFFIAGAVYMLVRKMSEPENMFRSLPDGLGPSKKQMLAGYQSWLASNNFFSVATFQFGIVQVAAFQQKDTQRFFFFNFHKQLTFCATTYFSDDDSLETSTSGDLGMFPRRPEKYAQSFPGLAPDETWRRHLEAEAYLTKKFPIGKKSLSLPYEQLLLYNIRRDIQYIRSIPLYPFRALYWFAVTRRRTANRSIQQQYP